MNDTIQINKTDNVAVTLRRMEKNSIIQGLSGQVSLADDVPQGHKIALAHISKGAAVVKYGYPIGKATADIMPGQWVHIHNMKSSLADHENYVYRPCVVPLAPLPTETFMGYLRDDGRAAVRNELWIIPGAFCVNDFSVRLARECEAMAAEFGLDGIYAFPQPYGCSQLGNDNLMTRRFLSSLSNHPNAGGVLAISLGCENNIPAEFRESVIQAAGLHWNPERVKFMVCQEVDDEFETGKELLRQVAQYATKFKRQSVPVSKLVVGMKCGGSDGLSGVTANPTVGALGDIIVAQGGSSIITEVPEMFGAEEMLLNRCISRDVFDKAATVLNEFKDYFISHGQPVGENPAPGNYEGGISSLEDKSLGCVQKGGMAPVSDVLGYAEQVRSKGLSILWGPGSDNVSAANLAAAGAHIVIFTTGRGTPICTAVPTLKISTGTPLFTKKPGWIDFNAGIVAEGTRPEEAAKQLMRDVLDIAGGRKTKGEENGYRGIAIFKDGVIL